MNNRLSSRDQVQSGLGWKSTLISGFNKLSNILPDADPQSRSVFPEEAHAIVKTDQNKWARASFEGPATRISARLRRKPDGSKQFPYMKGDPPRNSNSDLISRAHDLRYFLGKTPADLRQADIKMINSLDAAAKRGAPRVNIAPARLGIAAKIKAEDYSLLSKKAFISDKIPSKEDRELAQSELSKMEQRGLGGRPGEMLLKNLGKHVLKTKKRRRRRA